VRIRSLQRLLAPSMTRSDNAIRYSSNAGRWVIAATVLGSGMAAIDATVVGIALPTIGREFHAPLQSLQWVVTGYTLTLSSLLIFGGSLGDRFGRRRVFLIGVAWFALASVACAIAPSTQVLIATRMLQGVGAALLTPGSLAILQVSFAERDRGRAIGAWSGLGGVATALGPLLGGYLIAAASWRWIFLINLPLGAAVLAVSARHVPESRAEAEDSRVDYAGAVLGTVALSGLIYGLIEGPTRGWAAPQVLVALAVGIAAGIGLFAVERAATSPMLPTGLFRVRQFTVTNVVTLLVYAALGGVLFLLPVQLQVVDGYTPLGAGLSLLPVTVVMLALSARSGRLAGRIGPRLQMSVGPVVVGAGLALLARASSQPSYFEGVFPAVLVLGLGLAVTVAPLTITALGSVPEAHAGIASAVNNDVARIGGLVAVALLPALSGMSQTSYLHPAQLAGSFRSAVLIAGGWCVVAGGVAALGIRNPGRKPVVTGGAAPPAEISCHHCALDATPVATTEGALAE